ncbi:hypothetical protein Tco_0153118 [Tanacetum coccineum]
MNPSLSKAWRGIFIPTLWPVNIRKSYVDPISLGFIAALAVLITEASQSRQYGKSEPRENHDLRRQLAEERRERLELIDHVARMERRHEFRGE